MAIIFTVDTTISGSTNADQFQLPLLNGIYNCVVDWGDGGSTDTITAYNQAETLHTYTAGGEYTITITGACPGFAFSNTGDKEKLTSVTLFDCEAVGQTSMASVFHGCTNLTDTGDITNTSSVTTFSYAWHNCTSMTSPPDTSNWNTSNVTTFKSTWLNCTSMTSPPDTSNWNTSNVTTFAYTWFNCTSMTSPPDTSNWNTSNVTTFTYTWHDCTSMTSPPDTSNWNTSNVTTFAYTWLNCSFYPTDTDTLLAGLTASNPKTAAVPIHLGKSKYTPNGAASKTYLQSLGWTFDDGGPASRVFIPGIPDSNLCVDGSPKTIPSGNVSPNANHDRDYWDAAELNGIGVDTAFGADDDEQTTAPANTKFAKSVDGAKSRLVTTATALTGNDLIRINKFTS